MGCSSLDSFNYSFPVIRGVQSGREYYVTMVPLKVVPTLFLFNDPSLPPEMRAQRLLNKGRVPSLTKYLVENSENYVFSSLTASIDRMIDFKPIPEDDPTSKIGLITIPTDTRIIINDGQHRRAAIIKAIEQNPDLAFETISVVFFIDMGLKRSQQMFSDLNRYATKPSGSLNILYDHRDPFSKMVLYLIEEVRVFKDNIDFEKTSISNRSRKLFTLSSIYRANKTLLGQLTLSPDEWKTTAIEFWNEVTLFMNPWQDFLKGKPPYKLRQETIAVHDITLQAIAIIGSTLLINHSNNWREKLETLKEIDWTRENKEWDQRALFSGRLRKSYSNVVLTSNVLKKKLGIPLNPKEQEYEQRIIG
jgi:DNA sulfur modification protein DndB